MKYNILNQKIIESGYKKSSIAKKLKITPRAFSNKVCGKAPFTWEQVCIIQQIYFPDMTKEELFKEDENNK